MGNIIRTENKSTDRSKILRAIARCVRELALQPTHNNDSLDLVAFIVISLETVVQSVETTALAWEKRDYWVKADKFRMEWQWASQAHENLRNALDENDFDQVAISCTIIAKNLAGIHLSAQKNTSTDWKGAYQKYRERRPGRI